jgi:hypothetical protein
MRTKQHYATPHATMSSDFRDRCLKTTRTALPLGPIWANLGSCQGGIWSNRLIISPPNYWLFWSASRKLRSIVPGSWPQRAATAAGDNHSRARNAPRAARTIQAAATIFLACSFIRAASVVRMWLLYVFDVRASLSACGPRRAIPGCAKGRAWQFRGVMRSDFLWAADRPPSLRN